MVDRRREHARAAGMPGDLRLSALIGIYTIGMLASLPVMFVPLHVLLERVPPGAAFAASWQAFVLNTLPLLVYARGVAGAAGVRHGDDGPGPHPGLAALGRVELCRVEGHLRHPGCARAMSAQGRPKRESRSAARSTPVSARTARERVPAIPSHATRRPRWQDPNPRHRSRSPSLAPPAARACTRPASARPARRRPAPRPRPCRRGDCAPSRRRRRAGGLDHRRAIAHSLHPAGNDEPPSDHRVSAGAAARRAAARRRSSRR